MSGIPVSRRFDGWVSAYGDTAAARAPLHGWRLHPGCGAFCFHRVRARRWQHPINVKPPSFYFEMLPYPLVTTQGPKGPFLALSFVVAEIANAISFFSERAKGTWG
jgi:hypothetical protein